MKYLTMISQRLHNRLRQLEETLNRAADSQTQRGHRSTQAGMDIIRNAWA